jgi:uncharacterized RDD family membrane protein YckC
MKLAKVRHRFIATVVDNLIITLFMMIILIGIWPSLLYSISNNLPVTTFMVVKLLRSGIVYALFLLFYYMIIPMLLKGQTIGKWLFKIKVVMENGDDVDYKDLFFREAICRILVRTISAGISSIVSLLIILIRDDRKSLADVFAKTKVIDIKEDN